jgi:hypothetical protein
VSLPPDSISRICQSASGVVCTGRLTGAGVARRESPRLDAGEPPQRIARPSRRQRRPNHAQEPTASPVADRRGLAEGRETARTKQRDGSEISRRQAGLLRNSRKDPRSELLVVMEGEDDIRPLGVRQCAMRAGLALDDPPTA